MPEFGMEGRNGERFAKEHEEHYVPRKEIFMERSPRSPLSTHSPPMSSLSNGSDSLDLAIDGVVENSIEDLYNNVCEMQSSDHSPSRRSFLSYGEESRIDSELRFLAGGDDGVVETRREVVTGNNGGEKAPEGKKVVVVSKDDSFGYKINPAGFNCGSPTQARRLSHLQLPSEASRKATLRSKTLNGRPPNGKANVRGPKKLGMASSMKIEKSSSLVGGKLQSGGEENGEARFLGPYLLKQARDIIAAGGNNTQKALDLALRAMKSFEGCGGGDDDDKPNLDYVMCSHVVSALYCRLGRYNDAIPLLEKSIEIPVMDLGHNHALAKFAGCMQLGDTYAMLGQIDNSILLYTAGLEIQRQVLGENDPRFGETCRYLAEAHIQAIQFDEAEKLCRMALDIHKVNGATASPEEAADRRLLGLICDSKGDYESALEHYVIASMAMAANGQNAQVAAIDCSIGDAYLSLLRYDEAICAYQKALSTFKSCKGENHPSVGSVFVRLADLYNKIGKFSDSKSYCENAQRIYAKPAPGSPPEEIASGLVDISAIYETMNEPEQALQLLQKAIRVYGNAPGQQTVIAGIEAQMGVLYYILGSYVESYNSLKNSTTKFRLSGEKKSALFGIALNQMGLACVQLFSINEAADLFEEARDILESECGPYHADTLGVYSNLAGTYDAMGRTIDAIEILEYIVELREERLGTANPDVEDEKDRLAILLKEAGKVRTRKSRSLETLLVKNAHGHGIIPYDIEVS
ncbi:Tetratricopeptide repeat superfamily protein [Perilla frutescens var. hirtella]|uniref:Tetratricopeptide repeat superfamily protein n=1 Tax=Perilla frutescens var. hirtella TaxID=608512 RepID=A0AAD4JAZ4_PERFH|nr:Tetratricopeptide repeat superfamily protein [Perilla frutescens var. hirtella]